MFTELSTLAQIQTVSNKIHGDRIYLIEVCGNVKIGASKAVGQRIRVHYQHCVSLGVPIGRVIYSDPLDDAFGVEREALVRFSDNKVQWATEAFKMSIDEARDAIIGIIETMNQPTMQDRLIASDREIRQFKEKLSLIAILAHDWPLTDRTQEEGLSAVCRVTAEYITNSGTPRSRKKRAHLAFLESGDPKTIPAAEAPNTEGVFPFRMRQQQPREAKA